MSLEGVYGAPPAALAASGPAAIQLSPLVPGAADIETLADGSLQRAVIAAPPGALERRYALAHALRVLAIGGALVALAPKDRGGARLHKELAAFGCAVEETARRHQRICQVRRAAEPLGLKAAIEAGGPQWVEALGLWSQPGVFSWDRLDPGSALLIDKAPAFSGRGADLGCGIGVLARAVLAEPAVSELSLIDIDRRAVAAAARNIDDARARFAQKDIRVPDLGLSGLDFVIMNPPFHGGGREDRGLGPAFIAAAADMLRKGGVCRLVDNVALPYEAALARQFSSVTLLRREGGYKVLEARL